MLSILLNEVLVLNGIAPILIFQFPTKLSPSFLDGLGFEDTTEIDVGVPIPIYLDESLTGIYVETESSAIDIQTEADGSFEREDVTNEVAEPVISQNILGSSVTITMVAKRDAILLTALLALSSMVLKRVVTQEYSISYLNRSTAIFQGMLMSFRTNVNNNDDLIRIEMVLSTAKKQTTQPVSPIPPIPAVSGALPL